MPFLAKSVPYILASFYFLGALLTGSTSYVRADPAPDASNAGSPASTALPSPGPAPAAVPASPTGSGNDAVFAPVPTPVATVGTTTFSVSQVTPLAVLSVQSAPQADWQGGAPVASPETIVYSNGVVLYDWGSMARAQHDEYDPSKTYYDAASEEMITESFRKFKVVQLTQKQLDALIASLHETDLDKLTQTGYHYDKLPHYRLSYWAGRGASDSTPRTITVGGPLNNDDCDDSFFKTTDLMNLHGASEYEIDDARSHTSKPLLGAIDSLQYYDSKDAAFPDPNTFYLQLVPAPKAKAQPWPDNLPQIDDGALKPDDSNTSEFTADLQQSDYLAISAALTKSPKNNVYLIDGKPYRVAAQGQYILPALPLVASVLVDRDTDAAASP